LNVTDLPFNFEAGPRISAIHRLDRGCGLEINYFGIDAWSSSAVRDGTELSRQVIFPPGALVSTQFTVEYSSELYSAEANLRYGWRVNLDLLAGFRYAELQEDFSVVGEVYPPWTAVPSYVTHSRNHLYGFQIGAVARLLNRHRFLSVEGFFKTGVFGNYARQETTTVHNVGIPRSLGDSSNHPAFLAEVGLTGVCRLGDHWALRGGYQVMWLEGVALAPDQIPHTNFPLLPVPGGDANLHTTGSLVYHGCHVGIEARW
ncbi:MAG: BBP7 family outer membrane beta-barrel protein, partial [Planctomycetes bacterium]|nr:BBP7 family outer membrane beta-barrel protein [Planctomycetota bacterium]